MQGLPDTDIDFSVKKIFSPLTTSKAIIWIVILGLIVYANMLINGFALDDMFQIVGNPYIKISPFIDFSHRIGPYYKPLMFFTFGILYRVVGVQPFLYHFFQLIIHIANVVLLYIFLKNFFKNNYITFFLSLVFLVHPMNVETVVYASTLQDTYFVFFGLLSLNLITKKGFSIKVLSLSSFLLLLSLLSKESGFLFILIQTFYVFFYFRSHFRKQFLFIISVILIYFMIRFSVIGSVNPNNFLAVINNTILTAPLSQRIINIPEIILYYFITFFYPSKLAVYQLWFYQYISFSSFYLPLFIDLIIFLLFLFIGKSIKNKSKNNFISYSFFFIWILIGLGFHLQILRLDNTVAEHYFYFPEIGLLGMIGLFLQQNSLIKNHKNIFIIVSIFILLILSWRSIVRNSNWYSPETLYTHDLSEYPNNAILEYNLGLTYADDKNYPLAISYLRKTLEVMPDGYQPWTQLGDIYYQNHNYKQAEYAYQKAISINRDYVQAYLNLTTTYLAQNKLTLAKKMLENIVLIKWPDNADAWRLDGYTHIMLNDRQGTLHAFNKAYQLDPNELNSYDYFNLKNDQSVALQLSLF